MRRETQEFPNHIFIWGCWIASLTSSLASLLEGVKPNLDLDRFFLSLDLDRFFLSLDLDRFFLSLDLDRFLSLDLERSLSLDFDRFLSLDLERSFLRFWDFDLLFLDPGQH